MSILLLLRMMQAKDRWGAVDSYQGRETLSLFICFLCLCNESLFIKSVSDPYVVDFLGKGRVF